MIVVRGAVVGTPENLSELMRISLEHVARSRLEPGCISHEVSIDAENPLRLVFFERWEDEAALRTHFAVPASITFSKALRAMSAGPGEMAIYEAERVKR
jgi:quinol monooxygenase YgiN